MSLISSIFKGIFDSVIGAFKLWFARKEADDAKARNESLIAQQESVDRVKEVEDNMDRAAELEKSKQAKTDQEKLDFLKGK